MNYLAIDTSGTNLTLLLRANGKDYIYNDQNCGVNHSVSLMVELEKLVLSAGTSLDNMDFFAVVVGAGSFTGIRIGVATAKALCYATNKPILSITSFDTLAYNENANKVLAVIDAKHNGYYVCGYSDGKEVLSPRYINGEELIALESEYICVSSSTLTINHKIVDIASGLRKAIEIKQSQITFDLDSVVPLYVRKSQAEEGRWLSNCF